MSKEVNFDEFRCRCSAIHMMLAGSRDNPILTEKQGIRLLELEAKDTLTDKQQEEMAKLLVNKENGSKVILSDTFINYLMEEYAWRTQKMVRITKELEVSQMEKGKIVEPESLALLCVVDEVEYTPNIPKKREQNEFLSGEVDAYKGKSILEAEVIPDVKSTWDYPTFLCKLKEKLSPANDLQIKGYMDISGAREGFIADCLITTPEHVVNGLKWRLLNKMNVATEESPEFKERWDVLARSMNFDGIPVMQRVNKKYVLPFTDFERNLVYDRVKIGRDWLNQFHQERIKLL